MAAPGVQITLSKKKELIQAVKAGVQPKERRAIARRFLQDNGITGAARLPGSAGSRRRK
jgi:hypothetical protein